MTTSTGKSYYDVLNIGPEASRAEIAEAYRSARGFYSGDSPALYSLYTESEKGRVIAEIEHAYQTLIDPMKKNEYDARLASGDVYAGETPEVDIGALTEAASISSPVLMGGITKTAKIRRESVEVNLAPPMVAEQYRILFTRIRRLSNGKTINCLAITSSVKGEGKSLTAFNLAYLMSTEFSVKTVLVEADMRKQSSLKDRVVGLDGRGLSDVLRGSCELGSAIISTDAAGLFILPAGKVGNRTSEILSSPAFKEAITALRAEFDYVIVDSPPILPLADMNIISRAVGGVILVVRAGKTPKDIVKKAVESISDSNIVGTVLNATRSKMGRYYY